MKLKKSKKPVKKISKKLPKVAAKKKIARHAPARRKVARARKAVPRKRAPRKAAPRARPVAEPIPLAAEPGPITVSEALEIALSFERKARDHYARGVEAIQDSQGQKVFATLAKEEQAHIDYLESRLSEWSTRGAVEPAKLVTILPTPEWVRDAEIRHRQAANTRRIADQNEVELLKTALALEREASGFYHDLVRRLSTSDRGLFEQFLTIEDGHLAIVQAELDAVQGWGYWFDVQEFALEAQ